MSRGFNIIFSSFFAQLAPARGVKLFVGIAVLMILIVYAGFSSGLIPREMFESLHQSVIVFGIPLFATLFSELALRDGLVHRTLLYPLLGPASRREIAVARTLATGLVLFVGCGLLVTVIRFICEVPWNSYPRELGAILLASLAYVSIAGLIHLFTTKGLITSLVVFSILDHPIGRLPFAVRNLAPSYHTRVLTDQIDTYSLPISIDVSHTPAIGAVAYLVVLTAVVITATAIVFKRKNLGNLC
jgi:hypothetical protein